MSFVSSGSVALVLAVSLVSLPTRAQTSPEIEPVELGEPAEPAETSPARRVDALPSPVDVSQAAARSLANLQIQELALERDRGTNDFDQIVSVTLYVGGVALSIAGASLIIGVIFEAACVNGDESECVDAPSFVSAAIPVSVGAGVVLAGATIMQRRVDAWDRDLDGREREMDGERERREREVGLALGPGALGLRVRF